MVKIFNEDDRITVVFPNQPGASEAIEKILTDIYGKAEDVKEVEVKGLIAAKNPPEANGVQVVNKTVKQQHVRTNLILQDKRNPYDMLPYDAFKTYGISAMFEYSKMGLRNSENDIKISRELFADFKRYLAEINNENYLIETDIEEIKNIITVISTKIYKTPIEAIIKHLAVSSVTSFIETASEDQLRSAAAKVLNDTIKFLK